MKQQLFETRNKAEELLREALSIWRESSQADALEGIEKDPVFSLLMMALAYQANELDSELERLKAEVLEDFSRLLVPYEMGHAVPATAVVETALQDQVGELTMGEGYQFMLASRHPFIPLLETRVLNAKVRSVTRLDGRRWKVSVGFAEPVTDLSLFAFAIHDVPFQNVAVSVKGHLLPLVKPWHYSELPFTRCFSPETILYNQGQAACLSSLPMDLFARQNIRLFIIERHNPQTFIPSETEQIDFVFEFMGIPEDFRFDKTCLSLNPVVLVNAEIGEASLSSSSPVARIAGGENNGDDRGLPRREFLHLIRPPESQIYGGVELEVRGVAGDRFNQGSLVKLLQCIITKYRSDFYAFQNMKGAAVDDAFFDLESALSRLRLESTKDLLRSVSGVYLMPRNLTRMKDRDFSLNVKYLTTSGTAVNGMLGPDCVFTPPSGFLQDETRVIGMPVPGLDEIRDEGALTGLMRYQMLTGDRIVTMADVKAFCSKQLLVQYGIGGDLVRRLRVNRRLQRDDRGCGYEIVAEITLLGTSFVRRSFEDKIPMAETLMEQMIAVRSANIYPVRINIIIE
jgi:hypothetical protein